MITPAILFRGQVANATNVPPQVELTDQFGKSVNGACRTVIGKGDRTCARLAVEIRRLANP